MSVIYVLLAAHFLADFVCQSDWMALNKSKRWDALGWHVCAYTVVLAAALVLAGYQPSANVSLFIWTNAAAHFVQDAITSRITSRLWFFRQEPGIWMPAPYMVPKRDIEIVNPWLPVGGETRHWFFVAIGFDQFLHYVMLFVAAGWWLK